MRLSSPPLVVVFLALVALSGCTGEDSSESVSPDRFDLRSAAVPGLQRESHVAVLSFAEHGQSCYQYATSLNPLPARIDHLAVPRPARCVEVPDDPGLVRVVDASLGASAPSAGWLVLGFSDPLDDVAVEGIADDAQRYVPELQLLFAMLEQGTESVDLRLEPTLNLGPSCVVVLTPNGEDATVEC
jgi:hypothetical protein